MTGMEAMKVACQAGTSMSDQGSCAGSGHAQ